MQEIMVTTKLGKYSKALPHKIDEIAQNINHELDRIQGSIQDVLYYVFDIGHMLLDVKSALSHGEFTQWYLNNTYLTERTAQNYMNLARNKKELQRENISSLNKAYQYLTDKKYEDAKKQEEKEKIREYEKKIEGEFKLWVRRKYDNVNKKMPENWKETVDLEKTNNGNYNERFSPQESYRYMGYDTKITEKGLDGFSEWTEEDEEHFQKLKKDKERRDKKREEDFERWQKKWENWSSAFQQFDTSYEYTLGEPEADKDQSKLFRTLEDYFKRFENPNHRLHAIHNVVKKMKEIANKQHVIITRGEGENEAKKNETVAVLQ